MAPESGSVEQYDGYKVYRPPFPERIDNIFKEMAMMYTMQFRHAMTSGCKQYIEGQVPDPPPDGFSIISEGFSYNFVWPAVNATELAELGWWHLSSPLAKVTVPSTSPVHFNFLQAASSAHLYTSTEILSLLQLIFILPPMHESCARTNVLAASLQSDFLYISNWTPTTSPLTHGPRRHSASTCLIHLQGCRRYNPCPTKSLG